MLTSYPACFFKEENGYSVIFPNLNTATSGETLDEAMAMAIDCLAGYIYMLRQDGEAVPDPSPMAAVSPERVAAELDFDPGENFVSLVTVDVDEYAKKHFEKSVRKTLTIPAWLNALALENGVNFSQVLQEALKARLHTQS